MNCSIRTGPQPGVIRKLLRRVVSASSSSQLGDFTTTVRVVPISLIAIGIGALGAAVAWLLLRLIGLFTNLFYYQRLDSSMTSPGGGHLGWFQVLVPVAGGLIVGLMARYGSERIRGHGIPEALEAILISGSRVEPRVAVLKPVSAAISIGSGGPFGAEGPIIMTGGAFGSMVAQLIHLTSAERKTLLVAGAAAGMSATFATPVAAVLLAVELLLFEWKPRSLVPVVLASVTAGALRRLFLGAGPLFPMLPHPDVMRFDVLLGCVLVGVLAGILSIVLTWAVYGAEDAYHLLPIHWMWWPAIGGLIVGIGGMFVPRTLGVGYDSIGAILKGDLPMRVVAGILVVKSTIWAASLGSGTSGGVLAPLLLTGGALGGLEAQFLPAVGAGFWPLVSMSAVLGATMRVPLTATIFALELTHDLNAMLPLLIGSTVGYLVTVLVLKRSILTEKISRRGLHLSREYSIDPLEILKVTEVMRTRVTIFSGTETAGEIRVAVDRASKFQRLYPIVGQDGALGGVITASDIRRWLGGELPAARLLRDLIRFDAEVAYPDEPLRVVVYRMAQSGLTRFPVVDRERRRLLGIISLYDLLKARALNLEAEERRERTLLVKANGTTEGGVRAATWWTEAAD